MFNIDERPRAIFNDEHAMFRDAVRAFFEKEVKPYHEQWEEDGIVPRSIWEKAGAQGFLCTNLPEEYGGAGVDFLYSMILIEEATRARAHGPAFSLHSDIIVPYIEAFGSEEQKKRYLPKCATGECITAIAMTEPAVGSDLANMTSTAIKDGDHYVLNGSKTFISNGLIHDMCIVAAKTDPKSENKHGAISLFLVDADSEGYKKGRKLPKMGMHAQDTSELFFEDVKVPAENLLGSEGAGFYMLMQKLQQERLVSSIGSMAAAERVLQETIEYTSERKAFGKPINKFQNTRFKLVECATEIEIGRTFIDSLAVRHMNKENIVKETCMGKFWVPEMLKRTVDTCLQFFGGYGYMTEYPIAKAYMDVRVQTIFAGTTEIMKEIIGKQMGM